VTLPSLIVVSGRPGAGKTTLAHALARAVCCPAICRDEIKEGMVHAHPGFTPGPGDALTVRTFTTFFAVLDVLIANEVTVVAEAAFRDQGWRPELERLLGRADIRVICCMVDPDVADQRIQRRFNTDVVARSAHADVTRLENSKLDDRASATFEPLSLDVPTLRVDTTDGYEPVFDEIVAFARRRAV
jgi:predicted kinase